MIVTPSSPLLLSLEELAAITSTALIKIKPFRDWRTSKWKDKIFEFQILNAGLNQEVLTYINDIPKTATQHVGKVEVLIRAIHQVDSQPLVIDEELRKFNETASTELTKLDYLRLWANNLEQIVVDRLDAVSTALQLKQARMLRGQCQCDQCGAVYFETSLPEGSKKILFSVSEIICTECMPNVYKEDYDFYNPPLQAFSEDVPSDNVQNHIKKSNYTCVCGKEFEVFEEFDSHRSTCEVLTT